ncbi:MAG: hypothetical protein WCG85_14670 [Polyangia bacterium]
MDTTADSTPAAPCSSPDIEDLRLGPAELQRFLESLPCGTHSKQLAAQDAVLASISEDTKLLRRALLGEPELGTPGLVATVRTNIERIAKIEQDRLVLKNEAKGGLKTITSFGGFLAWFAVVIGGAAILVGWVKGILLKP